MRPAARYRRTLVTLMVGGVIIAFVTGWVMTGRLLGGVAEAAVAGVALGVAFALLARLLEMVPPPVDRKRLSVTPPRTSRATHSKGSNDNEGGQ